MRKYLPIFIISPLVLILDQFTKLLILKNLEVGQSINILQNFFEIVHVKNRGAAFGMFANWNSDGREWFFYLVSILAMTALFVIYAQSSAKHRRIHVPLAMILGGALGNLVDRVLHGEVTDFLVFHWYNKIAAFSLLGRQFRFALSWPAFNIADAAITCGAIYLIFTVMFLDSIEEEVKT